MSGIGAIEDVYLPVDRATGRPRGFAFVEFADQAAAEAAIEKFDGQELAGRTLRVNMAEERRPRPGGPPPGRDFGSQGGDDPWGQGGGGGGGGRPSRPKGSRRGARGKKRSL
jgi:RNA recognition motif-containing protein